MKYRRVTFVRVYSYIIYVATYNCFFPASHSLHLSSELVGYTKVKSSFCQAVAYSRQLTFCMRSYFVIQLLLKRSGSCIFRNSFPFQ